MEKDRELILSRSYVREWNLNQFLQGPFIINPSLRWRTVVSWRRQIKISLESDGRNVNK